MECRRGLALRILSVRLSVRLNNLQVVFVYALHPHRTSTKIPFSLCFCSQWQISTELHWLSGLLSAKNKNKIRWTWLLLLRSSRLEHSSIRPSWHYWYEHIPKTTQECTFWSCLQLTIAMALLDESYSGALQISRRLIDWLIDCRPVWNWPTFVAQPVNVGRIAWRLSIVLLILLRVLFISCRSMLHLRLCVRHAVVCRWWTVM